MHTDSFTPRPSTAAADWQEPDMLAIPARTPAHTSATPGSHFSPSTKAAIPGTPQEKSWFMLGSKANPSGSSPRAKVVALHTSQEKPEPHTRSQLQWGTIPPSTHQKKSVVTSASALPSKPMDTHSLSKNAPTQGHTLKKRRSNCFS